MQVDGAEDASDSSFTQYLSVPVDTAVMYATAPGEAALHPTPAEVLLALRVLRTHQLLVEPQSCSPRFPTVPSVLLRP